MSFLSQPALWKSLVLKDRRLAIRMRLHVSVSNPGLDAQISASPKRGSRAQRPSNILFIYCAVLVPIVSQNFFGLVFTLRTRRPPTSPQFTIILNVTKYRRKSAPNPIFCHFFTYFWPISGLQCFSVLQRVALFSIFMGHRTIIARFVAKWAIAQTCLCETEYQGVGYRSISGSYQPP